MKTIEETHNSDKQEYRTACETYKSICTMSEISREKAVELRGRRFAAHKAKIEAAENVLMSAMGAKTASLRSAGLFDFFGELTSGKNHDFGTLFKIADALAVRN